MFKKKAKEPIEESKEKPAEKEREVITFDVNDDCFVRAEKIIGMTGLCNPNSGMIGGAARGIKIYMDLDKKLEELKKSTKSKTKKEVK